MGEVASSLFFLVGGVAGFVAPSVYPQHQHDLLQPQPTPFTARQLVRCRATTAVRWRGACRMSETGSGSEEPSKDVVDSKGIDAQGGTDTKGIYGFAREIVEQEAAEAPFRRLRLIGYAVPAFIAVFLAGISLAGMAGLDEFTEASENLPNPLIDAGVVGVAFYLWVEEVKTKRSSLALLKKQYEEQSKVPNRSEPPSPSAADPTTSPPAPKKGMFEGVKETLDAVNKQSYYQALALNKELEEKGVLPPLERKEVPPGVEGATVAANEGPDASELATSVTAGGAEPAAA
ncbi:unnamed protein product, partial [Scytosiphon promiscuus]